MPKKRNSCRALMLIDDQKIRQEAFSNSQKIIQKMERLERKISNYSTLDQKLYEDWYSLSFAAEINEIAEKKKQLQKIQDFNFQLQRIAHHNNIPLSGAYRWALEEDRLYSGSDQHVRREIDELRRKRDLFFWEEQERLNAEHWDRELKRRKRNERKYEETFREPPPQENDDLGDIHEEPRGPDPELEPEIQKNNFDRPLPTPAQEELLKLIYRKIARLVHPDKQGPGNNGKMEDWELRIWQDAKLAMHLKDLHGLENHLKCVLLRKQQLNSLSIDDIRASQGYLQADLCWMEYRAKRLKRMPAWNFSQKKVTARLVGKLLKKLKAAALALDVQITLAERQHSRWDEESGVAPEINN